ncbi:metallophosphoesterase [Microbacterium excoecariae]|uniref:metallophosphoesterase n=1 Tax=Microbacterium excoecariae TaxID=2715210 RepID=UPI00140AC412|nr:metallophosphoesterase [Microbacterium excoecariae]NHI16153.1 phosphoesterase [Microbacterium excoecariae]
MPERFPARRPLPRALAAAVTAAIAATGVGLSAAPAAADETSPVFVSEIVADNVGYDHFEYVEVTNTADRAVSLADEGITFSYAYEDGSAGSATPLALERDVTLAPGESVALWLSYTTSTVDSWAYSADDFRAHTGAGADTQVVRITGQNGFANGGDRAIRVEGPSGVLGWSFSPSGSMAAGAGADFRAPSASGASALLTPQAPYTPGTVSAEQLVPGEDPEPAGPADIGALVPDPSLAGPPLVVTEILPDSTNVGGSDGYEFVELFNASSEPVGFADYALTYLYPQDTETNTNEALWPAVPADVVIPAGEALVLWIKNGANDDLTGADFNAHFGSELVAGESLVEVSSAGMANGSARGIAVRTNTGFAVNRAYYNMAGADDTSADQGIHYRASAEGGLQEIVEVRAASPGRVQVDQVPDGLVVPAEDAGPPTAQDLTAGEIDPSSAFPIAWRITDDRQVRTATLTLTNDIDADPQVVTLTHDGSDGYAHEIAAADLMGKAWYEYTLTVSDGVHTVTTEPRRVAVAGATTDPVRLNVDDGELVGGTHAVSAASDAYPSPLQLTIDGSAVATRPSLESEPMFVFEASQTDFYFRNGVRIGDEILHIFDEGTYEATETISVPVPLAHVAHGSDLAVSVWAGTKAGPWIDDAENNDDFVISGMRLVLPDGRTLRPAGYDDPTALVSMGDSAGKLDAFEAVFALPDDAFRAVAHDWDTTAVADGAHRIRAEDGGANAEATVTVDNTAPEVTLSVADGDVYQGDIVLDATVTDAAATSVVATFDGERVELGHAASSADLAPGEHVFSVSATDAVGNVADASATFLVPEEHPGSDGFAPDDGAEVQAGEIALQARVTDPTDDRIDATFLEGTRAELGDEGVRAASGTTTDAASLERAEAEALAPGEGLAPVASGTELPYQLFEVDVPADAGDGATARLTWTGTANADAQLILYARAADGSRWVEVTRHLTAVDGEEVTLAGEVSLADHAADGVVTALVQHTEGYAGPDLSTRETPVTPAHPEDTPRSEYDFTIAWESDTQYYNEEFFSHQSAIHDYVLDQRDEQNIQYLIHTGDIVDDFDQPYQWQNADPEYRKLDEAGLPYGVLAGNHDVGNQLADYSVYGKYFGEDRYAGNPWYGGSYENNRGHYDLFTAGGIDFITVYMGWDPQQDAIAWMNEVLARYPERTAILNLHEFMLTTGGLGPIPQQIMDEVVATNPNVHLVFSGHYHDAFTRTDRFDDTGDGVADRTVHSMLFDYQGLSEGGLGYLRLLQFDNDGGQMRVRTYSPSLLDYNSDEASLLGPDTDPYVFQDFTVSYADLGISVREKRLETSAFRAEVLTEREIGRAEGLASGSIAATMWRVDEPGAYGWYVRTTDDNGGSADSVVQRVRVTPGTDPEPPAADPSLSLGASRVTAGDAVRVSVAGFPPGSAVTLWFDTAASPAARAAATPTALGDLTVGADGRAESGVTIPAETPAGDYVLRAVAGDAVAEADLGVRAAQVSPGAGGAGSGTGAGGTGSEPGSGSGGSETVGLGTGASGSGGVNEGPGDAQDADARLRPTGGDAPLVGVGIAALALLALGALTLRRRRA